MSIHTLPALPYQLNDLEPHLSAETLDFHYNKHHRTYVDQLNQLLPGNSLESASLEELVQESSGSLFHQAAQVWNHTFYWNSLTPRSSGRVEGKLLAAIHQSFGSIEIFRAQFEKAAMDIFGSGWAWLIVESDGRLGILQTQNAETPLRQGKTALMTVDVWEHAYYIDYRNARAKYVSSLWDV